MTAFWEFLKVIQTKIDDEKEDKERVGKVSNMFSILESQMQAGRIIRP